MSPDRIVSSRAARARGFGPRLARLSRLALVLSTALFATSLAGCPDPDVEISYDDATVNLRVRDHGPGPAEELLTGHGIVGMRDRATLAGGTFSCGAAEGGGFVVDVALPVGEGSA